MPAYIKPEKLKRLLDSYTHFTIVDTRSNDDFLDWHVNGAINFTFSSAENRSRDEISNFLSDKGVQPDEPIVTICAKGKISYKFAEHLEKMGYTNVKTVEGGMEGWSRVYDVVPIATKKDDLVILQLQRRAKGCLGYVIGSKETDEAGAIDVSRYTNKFINAASDYGLRITAVFDTHIHADHISGGRKLAQKFGVKYYLGSRAEIRG